MNLKAESVFKYIIIYITSFQTIAVMHELHYLKSKILPHTNCEHIKDMLSLQPTNQHNNSYKENSCQDKYKINTYCSLMGTRKRTQIAKTNLIIALPKKIHYSNSINMAKVKKVSVSQVAQSHQQWDTILMHTLNHNTRHTAIQKEAFRRQKLSQKSMFAERSK